MNRTKSLSKSTLISCISWFLFSIHAHGMEEEKLIRKLKSLSDYKLMYSDMQLYDLGKDSPESMFSSFTKEAKELAKFPFPEERVQELTRKEVYARLSQGGNKEILEILASSLYTRLGRTLHNEAIVHNFFQVFQHATRWNPPEAYRNILKEFLDDNDYTLKKLPLSKEQFEYINSYGNKTPPTGTALLEKALKTGNADEFFAIFKTLTVLNPTDNYRETLNKFFQDKAEEIKKLPFSIEQIRHMGKRIWRVSTLMMLLEEGLERAGGDAGKFFSIFKAFTDDSPSDAYRDALRKFFVDNAEEIKKFPFSIEQIGHMGKYIDRVSILMMLLEAGLERAGGDADKFFSIFKALTDDYPSPSKGYRDALKKFFADNVEEIKKLPFSIEQIGHMGKYIDRVSILMMLLEEGLERAGGDADKFFGLFEAFTDDYPSLSEGYRDALSKFFKEKAGEIKKLPFSIEQIGHMGKYIDRVSILMMLLEEGLERAGGDADKFFSIFKALTDDYPSPSDIYRDALSKFFKEKAGEIKKLPFSIEQIGHMGKYIDRVSILMMLLEEGLERAGGDADKFFSMFKGFAVSSPTEAYRNALSKFFEEKAGEIKKLPFSMEQIGYMSQYIGRVSTSIMLLEEGLELAGGDADKFFSMFKGVAVSSPTEAYRDALEKFFVDKAGEIKKLPFSMEQIGYINKYINKISVGIMLLERGLERAGGDADKFFGLFNALTDHSPSGVYRKALNKFFSIFNPFTDHSLSEAYRGALDKFFNDNIEAIKKLPFSFRQVRHMANYAKNDKILVMFLEGGLERAGGDADKFFNAFREVAIFFPSREYREALEEFFLEKAETILDLGLSTNQIRYMDHYIKRPSVSAEVFETALKKSGESCAASVIALFSLEGLNSEANAESDALLYQ